MPSLFQHAFIRQFFELIEAARAIVYCDRNPAKLYPAIEELHTVVHRVGRHMIDDMPDDNDPPEAA